jgi:pyridoxine kinase
MQGEAVAKWRGVKIAGKFSAMAVLSIQSHVVQGHAGNAVAAFALQRMGIEVWPLMTVQLAQHTGHGPAIGGTLPLDNLRDVIAGLDERGILGGCRAVLSGYLGSLELGEAVLDAVARVKEASPAALFLCDPVMGDSERGLYVDRDLPAFLREQVAPLADILTPNLFELGLLTGWQIERRLDLFSAVEWLLESGPDCLLVTSADVQDTPAECVEMLAATREGIWRLLTPRLRLEPPPGGAGDLMAALFLGRLLQGSGPAEALSLAGSALHAVLARLRPGGRDLPLVAAQAELVEPPRLFEAERVV